MSKNILRSAFSALIRRPVVTLSFDRSCAESTVLLRPSQAKSAVGATGGVSEDGLPLTEGAMEAMEILQKLRSAREKGAVVITTPQSIKTIYLKYIELLQVGWFRHLLPCIEHCGTLYRFTDCEDGPKHCV